MKTNEKKDLQTKTRGELVKLLIEAEKSLMDLKLALQQAKLQNTSEITNTRKKIAVLKTILRGKPAEEAKVEAKESKKKEVKKVS